VEAETNIDSMFRLTIVLFIVATCRAQSTNPLAGDPQAAETGRRTFRILCAPFHGIHADSGRGPDLTRGIYSVGDQDKDLYGAIARGIPSSEMPAYGDRMDADAVWRLVSYIRSVARHERRPRADCGVSDGALDSYLGISRYDQASLPLIDRLRRKRQGHSGNQGIPARLRETHQ
jgi:mono/diheme cytochrome c family protein